MFRRKVLSLYFRHLLNISILVFAVLVTAANRGSRCGGGDVDKNIWIDSILPNPYPLNTAEILRIYVSYQNGAGKYIGAKSYSDYGNICSNPWTLVTDPSGQLCLEFSPLPSQLMPPGIYEVIAGMDSDPNLRDPKQAECRTSSHDLELVPGSGSSLYTLSVLAGDSQSGRLLETLNDTILYRIRVRMTDNYGIGINHKPVIFNTNIGYFTWSDFETHTIHNTDGVAEAQLALTSTHYPTYYAYDITVRSDSAWNEVKLYERCVDDNEISGIISPYTHKRWYYPDGPEIWGDLYPDLLESGVDVTRKNIKIEIDYNPSVITTDELDWSIIYALGILETARENSQSINLCSGIWTDVAIESDAIYCSNYMTDEEIKTILAQERDFDDYIHVVIGTRYEPDPTVYGKAMLDLINVAYGDYTYRMFHIGNKSSGQYMQDSLDRCGVAIFAQKVRGELAGYPNIDFAEYVGILLAHEIGHSLQMGHTDRVVFGRNVMDNDAVRTLDGFVPDSVNFFNLNSLDDAEFIYPAPNYTPVLCALSTREQLGIHTTGFCYQDKEAETMQTKILLLLTGFSILGADPISVGTINKIANVCDNVLFKNAEVIVRFERDNTIGAAWFEMQGEPGAETYNFSYVRFNSDGDIILDMRNFMVAPAQLERYGVDWEESIPMLYSISNNSGNTWLIYSYIDDVWRVGWTRVDSSGVVIKQEPSIFPTFAKPRRVVGCPSEELGFHLYLNLFGDVYYYNPQIDAPKPLDKRTVYAGAGIEVDTSRFLLIDPPSGHPRWVGPDSFTYRIIDDSGNLIEQHATEWKPYVAIQWEDTDFPEIYATFMRDSVVNFIFTIDRKLNLMTFTAEGEIIEPDQCRSGVVQEIAEMPKEAVYFLKIAGDQIHYFGFSGEILYYLKKRK